MGAFSIRPCRVDEAQALLDLWQRSGATPSRTDNLEMVATLIESRRGSVLVAVSESDDLLGSIIAAYDGWRGNLYRLAVDPSVRRQGIASALVTTAENRLREAGAVRVTALVESDHPFAWSFWSSSEYTLHEAARRFFRNLD